MISAAPSFTWRCGNFQASNGMYDLIVTKVDCTRPQTTVDEVHQRYTFRSDARMVGDNLLALYGDGGLYAEGWVRGYRVEPSGELTGSRSSHRHA